VIRSITKTKARVAAAPGARYTDIFLECDSILIATIAGPRAINPQIRSGRVDFGKSEDHCGIVSSGAKGKNGVPQKVAEIGSIKLMSTAVEFDDLKK